MATVLPPIPSKRYFTIGEVSELCGVKPHVLRYWEQEFTQLRPIKRRGNRRYYQHHEVLLVRRIRDLLYEQGFTISGARQQLISNPKNQESMEKVFDPNAAMVELQEERQGERKEREEQALALEEELQFPLIQVNGNQEAEKISAAVVVPLACEGWQAFRQELLAIKRILEED